MAPRGPWLEGLIAVAKEVDATAARAELKQRGMRVRSIPGGAAKAAWNAVDAGGRTVAVVLSSPGPASTLASAGYWALQARRLVTLATSGGTGLLTAPALLLDGDATLAARARTALPDDPPASTARIGSLTTTDVPSPEALASLAAAGFAGVDTATDTWRAAARRLGLPSLAVHALHTPTELPDRLRRLEPPTATGRSRWRTTLALLRHPGDRARLRQADAERLAAARMAARGAVAACLGPP